MRLGGRDRIPPTFRLPIKPDMRFSGRVRRRVWRRAGAGRIAGGLLAAVGVAASAAEHAQTAQRPVNPVYPLAKSALLAVDATPDHDALTLHIRRLSDQRDLLSDDVKVTIDGKTATVTRQTDGSYEIGSAELSTDTPHDIELIVPHDGIRELLSGTVKLPAARSGGGLLGEHKQIAWWILNIVVVLIAVIAISRRKSNPPPDV